MSGEWHMSVVALLGLMLGGALVGLSNAAPAAALANTDVYVVNV